ncbi:MAG: hypothetical protein AB1403_04300 [Candidatus Riflebacteria bacterium]
MTGKWLKILVGALVLFVLTNLFFPEIFSGKTLAYLAPGLFKPSLPQMRIYYIEEGSEDAQLMALLKRTFASQHFWIDLGGRPIDEKHIENEAFQRFPQISLLPFDEKKAMPDDFVVKFKIFTADGNGSYPVAFGFYRVTPEKTLKEATNFTRILVLAGKDQAETARTIGEMLSLAGRESFNSR